MAKSIRSKWKRKCRNIKRERYAVKELARLKKMLGVHSEEKKPDDAEVMESDQVIFLDAGALKKDKKNKKPVPEEKEDDDVEMSSDDEKVEVEENGKTRIFSSKTLKDQNGQYPVWLHKRKIKKINKVGKKTKKRSKGKRKRS